MGLPKMGRKKSEKKFVRKATARCLPFPIWGYGGNSLVFR